MNDYRGIIFSKQQSGNKDVVEAFRKSATKLGLGVYGVTF